MAARENAPTPSRNLPSVRLRENHSFPMESFQFMNLPPELRNKIYYFGLVATGDLLVPRGVLEPRAGIRFRYNQKPKLWKAISPDRAHKNWFDIVNTNYLGVPINTGNFAFGLLFASRSTYNESTPIFYSETHFVLEDRFNLHMFINTIGKNNVRHLQSVSIDLRKSSGMHSDEIKQTHQEWQLHFKQIQGPKLAESVKELQSACPKLEYLEVQLYGAVYLPTMDYKELDKHYSEWEIIKALCSLSVLKFSFITTRGYPQAEAMHDYPEMEKYINNQIRSSRQGRTPSRALH